MSSLQLEIFGNLPRYQSQLPRVTRVDSGHSITNIWDIPQTISDLSYLTHSHYRYYGKFPSAVAAQILQDHGDLQQGHYVLDNFCGSGTTLVEAKLRHVPSYGLDISWISALVSNVKTEHVNLHQIRDTLKELDSIPPTRLKLPLARPDFARKWFSEQSIADLQYLSSWIESLHPSGERDFLLVGFLAIVRRVSRAFDGEVRPHINPYKKERQIFEAFRKKIREMMENHRAFQAVTKAETASCCAVGTNLQLPERFFDGKCGLVISHPPYLNSFNYRPVYSLEFYWGAPFERAYVHPEHYDLNKSEVLAHPATESVVEQYFRHLNQCYTQTFNAQPKGGKLAVVIGDCTRGGELIRVIDRIIDETESIGYALKEKNYRTTHYGLGKYAYAHRADYHGDTKEKRDAIVIFEK